MAKKAISAVEPSTAYLVSKPSKERSHTNERPTKVHRKLWHRYQDSWLPEIIALTFSILCIIVVAVILETYDGKPNPRMKWGLTLNAVVSILATTSKVSLIFAMSNSIGQLKWVWFLGQYPRSLLDVSVYDDASRGPLGAVIMLWTEARKSIASIGAVLTLLAVAYDPFVQQIISFEAVSQPQPYTDESVIVNAAHHFLVDGRSSIIPDTIRRSIQAAYWTDDITWDVSCPSQNCTWAPFETLAWHTKCYEDKNWTLSEECGSVSLQNLTGNMAGVINCTASSRPPPPESPVLRTNSQYIDLSVSYSVEPHTEIPGSLIDYYFHLDSPVLSMASAYDISSQYNSISINASVDDLGIIYNFSTPVISLSAFKYTWPLTLNVTTCELDIFLDTYQMQIVNNVLDKKLLKSLELIKGFSMTLDYYCGTLGVEFSLQPAASTTTNTSADQSQYHVLGEPLTTNSSTSPCILDYQYQAVQNWIRALNTTSSVRVVYLVETSGDRYGSDSIPESAVSSIYGTKDEAFVWQDEGPERVMQNLAASMNRAMLSSSRNPNGTTPIYGQASIPITLVRVTWPWVTLPLGLCVSAIVFFLATVRVSHKAGAPLWKSSVNAFFYHGIDFDSGIWTPLATVPEMDAQAASTRAKLASVGIFERLMLETSVARRNY